MEWISCSGWGRTDKRTRSRAAACLESARRCAAVRVSDRKWAGTVMETAARGPNVSLGQDVHDFRSGTRTVQFHHSMFAARRSRCR